jgi:hypothetical protein
VKLIRIVDWPIHFEKNRTREMKVMSWVPVPAKQGSGYCALMAKKDGPAIYGAWCAMLLLAASCPVRGTLTRGSGIPHNAESLSVQLRMPKRLIESAISVLSGAEIGWLECGEGAEIPQASRSLPAPIPHLSDAIEEKRREEKRRREESNPAPSPPMAIGLAEDTLDKLALSEPDPVDPRTGREIYIRVLMDAVNPESAAAALVRDRLAYLDWHREAGKTPKSLHFWIVDGNWRKPLPTAKPPAAAEPDDPLARLFKGAKGMRQ